MPGKDIKSSRGSANKASVESAQKSAKKVVKRKSESEEERSRSRSKDKEKKPNKPVQEEDEEDFSESEF